MITVFYPIWYGTTTVTMTRLREVHEPRMHPEFARRLFPWIESMRGLVGIGGGWRSTQPDRPGFAPDGKSFHQTQRFASGFEGYAAVDLVVVNGASVHRAPTWAESETAPEYGLHTFITGEPWHMQPIEIRGWQSWVNAGRPDPERFTLPGDVNDDEEDDDMAIKWIQPDDGDTAVIATNGMLATWVNHGHAAVRLNEIDGININTDPVRVPRTALLGLTLLGSPPQYAPGYTGPRTTAAHFAGHVT